MEIDVAVSPGSHDPKFVELAFEPWIEYQPKAALGGRVRPRLSELGEESVGCFGMFC